MSQQPPRKLIHLPKVRMLSRGARFNPGIRITNIRSIKPPDPEATKKQEEEQLRAQLQKEIVSRSRTCMQADYPCSLPVLEGQRYCVLHILRDNDAPYRCCQHDQCVQPVRADSDNTLCFEHARAALLSRQRAAAPPPPVLTAETMLNQLQHYVRPERARTESCTSSVSVVSEPNNDSEPATPAGLDPFKEIAATAINSNYASAVMECGSASDSDGDSVVIGDSGCRYQDQTEDTHGDMNPLWCAGVFTAEEAICEAKNTLRTLQNAYIGQMGRLNTLLKIERRRYLKALRLEREQYCSINTQAVSSTSARERRQLRKLKAYAGYRHRHTVHAMLYRKLLHKRAKVSGTTIRVPTSQARCIFTEGGVRCATNSLPAAKHCLKHITCNPHQVLFTTCADTRGGVSCREVIPRLPHATACAYHTDPPTYTHFTLKKDESDGETESTCSTLTAQEHSGNVSLMGTPRV